MIMVKRYDFELFHCNGGGMSPDDNGAYVSYEDYEAMEAKCAAQAAENAGLKDAAEFAAAPDMWEDLGGNVMRYQYQEWYADKLKSAMHTPATDAFLAEVRAQGVEIAVAMFVAESQHLPNETRSVLRDVEGMADLIRKGL